MGTLDIDLVGQQALLAQLSIANLRHMLNIEADRIDPQILSVLETTADSIESASTLIRQAVGYALANSPQGEGGAFRAPARPADAPLPIEGRAI